MGASLREKLQALGPGLVLAAAGIGAGDVVVASVTGIRFGLTLLWAVVLTAALKFVLTEALARWQLATGETIARAWVTRWCCDRAGTTPRRRGSPSPAATG